MFMLTRLTARHGTAIAEHLLALAPEDRRHRFMAMVSDDYIRRYVAGAAPSGDLLIGAFNAARLVALAHVAVGRDAAAPDEVTVEIGLSVHADARRLGLGRELCLAAKASATALGARRMLWHFSSANRAMLALAHGLGAVIEPQGSEAIAVLVLKPALHPSAVPPLRPQPHAGLLVSSFGPSPMPPPQRSGRPVPW